MLGIGTIAEQLVDMDQASNKLETVADQDLAQDRLAPLATTIHVSKSKDLEESNLKQRYQRLQFLLDKALVYSKFLADKIVRAKGGGREEAEGEEENKSLLPPSSTKHSAESLLAKKFTQPLLMTGGSLRKYQLEGIEWLVSLYENGMNGILADEMGLGKTIQCIGLLAFLREQGVWGPFLIVAPLSTLSNWVNEIAEWTPTIPVLLYHGSQAERTNLRMARLSKLSSSFPIVVTSYEMAMRDRKHLLHVTWKFLVVDEGHRIKNLNCKLVKELKSLNSENRLLLTGTPLQNNLSELWSLLNFLLPDIFDDLHSFQNWFDFSNVEDEQDAMKLLGEEAQQILLTSLHSILKPFLLRRLKSDVESELPPKKEYLLLAPMTASQIDWYRAILSGNLKEFIETKYKVKPSTGSKETGLLGKRRRARPNYNEPNSDDDELFSYYQEKPSLGMKDKSTNSTIATPPKGMYHLRLQNTIMQLRKACNHPFLFYHPPNSKKYLNELVASSGKIQLLDRLLPKLNELGHRTLIFSQMTQMLNIIEDYLLLQAIQYCRIDGSMSQISREEQIAKFNAKNSNIPVFILSTRAGGLGINLTAADTVIFYDSDWNPQMDLQAMDRVHRIGQTKPVLIFRLVTRGSIENRILERARSKRLLEKLVIYKKKFKGGEQLLQKDDGRIIFEELEGVLKSELAEIIDPGDRPADKMIRNQVVLSDTDLKILLDRTPKAFSSTKQEGTSFRLFNELSTNVDPLSQLFN